MEMKIGLHLNQKQQLVMTPQLQQAIKMLQLSNIELNQLVEEELTRDAERASREPSLYLPAVTSPAHPVK